MRFYFGKYTGLLQFGNPPEEEKKERKVDDTWSEKKKCKS